MLSFSRNLYSEIQNNNFVDNIKLTYGYNDFIKKDSRGVIWISSIKGVYSFNSELQKHYSLAFDENIQSNFFEDSNGDIWVTSYTALHKYNRKKDSFSSLQLTTQQNDTLSQGYHLFYIDSADVLWLNISGNIYTYNFKKNILNKITSTNGVRFSVMVNNDGHPSQIIACPWITGSGFERIKISGGAVKKEQYWHRPILNKTIQVSKAFHVNENSIFFFSNVGIVLWNLKKPNDISKFQLPNRETYSLRAGIRLNKSELVVNIPNKGLWKFDISKKKFTNHIYNEGIDKTVRAIFYYDDILWLSRLGSGLQYLTLHKNDNFEYKNDFNVLSMEAGHNGKIWCATEDNKLFVFENNKVGEFPFFSIKEKLNDDNLQISLDSNGKIWQLGKRNINFYNDSLQEWSKVINLENYSPIKLIHRSKDEKLLSTFEGTFNLRFIDGLWQLQKNLQLSEGLNDFFKGNGKRLYISPPAGVLKIQEDKNEIFTTDFGDLLNDIFEDEKKKETWLVTEKGLASFNWNKNREINYLSNNFNLKRNLINVVKDNLGRIWASDVNNIIVFDDNLKTTLIFRPEEISFGNYFKSSNILYTNDNDIWIGSNEGILTFNPDSIAPYPVKPPIILSKIKINNAPYLANTNINELKKLILKHHENNININPIAISYYLSKYNEIHYYLKDYDDDWRYIKNGETIEYYRLNPGNYILEMYGVNANGIRGETRTLQIEISPPWYNTWWAYLLFFITFFGLFFGGYRFLLNQRLKQAEAHRLKELDRIKTALYTNITHEFRTPLTIILGMVNQIKDKPQKGFSKGLEMIQRSGQNLLNLVNQMLDLSKVESGNLQPKYVQGDIVHFLQYLVESFHSYAESKRIMVVYYNEISSLVMDYDVDKLQTIIINLLSNATKFTPEKGKIIVHIQQLTKAEKSFCQIKIKDNGIGIDEKDLPHIFDRFYQVDDTATRHSGGTGIGLALTKELVELVDGTISAQSQLNQGTEFTILLPIRRTAPFAKDFSKENLIEKLDQKTITETEIEASTTKAAFPSILIIEDNLDVITYLQSCLEDQYQINIALDGQIGIEKALELIPDIIITDVMMPYKDGFEVCEFLKQEEKTSHIPIIMLTAKAQIEARIEGLSKGADAYLSKPFHQKELEVRLAKLLEQRKRLQAHYSQQAITAYPKIEDPFIQKVIDLVESDLSASLDLETFAQSLAMSRTQVYRKIKAMTGESTSIFIRRIRLKNAHHLLLTTPLSISEIAYAVGFKDPSFFSRTFSETYQKSPTQLREANKKQ